MSTAEAILIYLSGIAFISIISYAVRRLHKYDPNFWIPAQLRQMLLLDPDWQERRTKRKHKISTKEKNAPHPTPPTGQPLSCDDFFERVKHERTSSQKSEEH